MKHGGIRDRWRRVLLGTGMGNLVLVCGCAGGAALIDRGAVDVVHLELLAAAVLMLAALVGCLTARLGGGDTADAALTAAAELVVLLCLNGVLNGWEVEGLLPVILVLAGACGAASLLGPGGKGKSTRRRRKNR